MMLDLGAGFQVVLDSRNHQGFTFGRDFSTKLQSDEPLKVMVPHYFPRRDNPHFKQSQKRHSKKTSESPKADGVSLADREKEAFKIIHAKGLAVDRDITIPTAFLLYVDAARKAQKGDGDDGADAMTANELRSFRIYLATIVLPFPTILTNSEKKLKAAKIKAILKSVTSSLKNTAYMNTSAGECGTNICVVASSAFLKAVCDRLAYDKHDD